MNARKSVFALIACLALMSPLMGCDSPEQKEARHIKRGNVLFEKGELEKARIEYKNAARLKPAEAEPFYRIGLVDESQGDLRNAFINFNVAEQQNSHFHPVVLKIAQYYMAAERYDETRKRLDTVLSEAPDNAEAHALLAALQLREKNLDEAEKEAHTALAKDPANISACSALTGIYSAKEDYAKAEAAVNDGIAHNPQSLALMMLRVMLHERMNDLTKVSASYHAIFQLKPQEIQFRVDLATVYVGAGKTDEAEATFREGVAALPDNWDMKHQLVLFLDKQRGPDVAEQEIKNLMQANPKKDDLYFWLADLYASHGETDKAATLLEQIVAHGDFDAPALNARTQLARIGIKRGDKALAEKLVAAVLAKAPDNRPALFVRANLSFDNGYYQSAVSDLRTIVRDAPNDQEALLLLGETLMLQNRLDLAIDTMKRLTDLNPTNFASRVRLAQMVHMNGDTKQALEIISLVTQTAPEYPIGWEAAARIAIDAKEWLPAQAAIRELDKLSDQHPTAAFLEGQILDKNDKSEEAIAKYTEVINADPNTPLAEHALGALIMAYQKLGRLETAASYIATLKSDSPFIATMLGKCLAVTGKTVESAEAFDRAIAGHSSTQDPYLGRAELYLKEHQTEAAIEVLKKGIVATPNDFRAPLTAATLLSNVGKYQEAIALYDNILLRNPGMDIAANNLAEIIADYLPNDSAALEKARQTAERFSGSSNPLLLDTLAWVYFRQDNIPLAQTIIERAISRSTELPAQIHYHYGAILMKGGNHNKAREELAKAVVDGADYPGIEEAKKLLSQK